MAFITIPGIPGRIYVPDTQDTGKKHNCPDCLHCQWCSDTRCDACLAKKKPPCNPHQE